MFILQGRLLKAQGDAGYLEGTCPVIRAGSDGRCNTLYAVDGMVLPLDNRSVLLDAIRPKQALFSLDQARG